MIRNRWTIACAVLWGLFLTSYVEAQPPPKEQPKVEAKAPGTSAGTAAAKVSLPATAASQPAATPQVPGEPLTPAQAIEKVKEGIEFGKAKNWFGLSSVAILVLVFLFKVARDKWFPSFNRRWLYIIVPVLGIISMLLAGFVGGVSWGAAWLVLTSAPCAALFSDLIKRGIMGQEPSTGGG